MHPRHLALCALALGACADPVTPADPATPPAPPPVEPARVAYGDTLYELIDLGLAAGTESFLTPSGDVFFRPSGAGISRWHDGVLAPFTVNGREPTFTAANSSGALVGYYQLPNSEYRSFILQDGVATDLGTLGAIKVFAYDVNDHGAVVGKEVWADGTTRAFLWNAGRMHDLGGTTGQPSTALKINRRGVIMGTLGVAGPPAVQHAVLWRHQVVTDLGPLLPTSAGYSVYPRDLAEDGTVVGYGYVPGTGGSQLAFRSIGDSLEPLPLLGNNGSNDAFFVNGKREIAGAGYHLDSGDSPWGYLWRDGAAIPLGDLFPLPSDTGGCDRCGKAGTFLQAMNDSGVIVGRETIGLHSAAFAWKKGVMIRLPGLGGGYGIATAVNASGQIAGFVSDSTQYHILHAVLWRPRALATAVATRP